MNDDGKNADEDGKCLFKRSSKSFQSWWNDSLAI
jgi:hypothetical protein